MLLSLLNILIQKSAFIIQFSAAEKKVLLVHPLQVLLLDEKTLVEVFWCGSPNQEICS